VLRFVHEDAAPVSIELADGHVADLIRMLEDARRDQVTGGARRSQFIEAKKCPAQGWRCAGHALDGGREFYVMQW